MKLLLIWGAILCLLIVAVLFIASVASNTGPDLPAFLQHLKPKFKGGDKATKYDAAYQWRVYVVPLTVEQFKTWRAVLAKQGWAQVNAPPSNQGFSLRHGDANNPDEISVYMDTEIVNYRRDHYGFIESSKFHEGRASIVIIQRDQPALFERLFDWLGL
jgi:hypothetical protein